jgi:hypothetical protein
MSRASRLALSLALCLCLPLAAGCSSDEGGATDDTKKEEEVVLTDEDVKETDLTDEAEDEDDKTDAAEADDTDDADEQTQHVGADGTGFVDVPATWVEFHDTDGNDSIQWCDGTPYTIISLNTFNVDSVPEEERADFDAEDAANSVWANMLNDGCEEDSVQGARVTLAGRDAVQVYGVYPDGSFLVCWLLQDDAGVIRYVAAEGTQDTITDSVEIVENTYAL